MIINKCYFKKKIYYLFDKGLTEIFLGIFGKKIHLARINIMWVRFRLLKRTLEKAMKSLKEFIDTYKDYPKEGIEFKDVLGIIQEPRIFKELILKMSSSQIIKNAEAIISIDARGFIFGSAISLQVSKPMIVARKPGKLPGELVEKNYSLEYSEDRLFVQKKALKKYSSYAIVDDLLATGGTVNCVSKILESNNKEVVGILVVVELLKLQRKLDLNYPIESFITFWW